MEIRPVIPAQRRLNRDSAFFALQALLLVLLGATAMVLLFQRPAAAEERAAVDRELSVLLTAAGARPITTGPTQDPALVRLGEALYFDKILSGNRDISCATCHHPLLASGDGRSLPAGTGGQGLGAQRLMGVGREFVPRNAPEIFNRGDPAWFTMFWDGRVAADPYEGEMSTPAGRQLVDQIDGALAAQALFPPTSRHEMRGAASDRFVQGHENELSQLEDEDFLSIWEGVMARLLAISDYRALFAAAYPDVPQDQLTMAHAANAIAAYEIVAFSFTESPYDRYLAGDTTALSAEQKEGAMLFFGRAKCVACHSGPLLTDQRYYNLAVPQFGPGKDEETGLDLGREGVTGDDEDRFAFRTPPLRNVTITGPYMHNGAYASLEDAIRHHLDPAAALAAYDAGQLPAGLQETLRNDAEIQHLLLATLENEILDQQPLTDDDVALIMAFLESVTDPAARDLSHLVPASVPSGLPVKD